MYIFLTNESIRLKMKLDGAAVNFSGSGEWRCSKMSFPIGFGGRLKNVISKDQELLEAAKTGNVEAIEKLTAKRRQSTAAQLIPRWLSFRNWPCWWQPNSFHNMTLSSQNVYFILLSFTGFNLQQNGSENWDPLRFQSHH